jgi:hypothetical protein
MMTRMVKRAILGLLVVGAASCGGGSGDSLNADERALQGTWAFEESNYEALAMTFRNLDYELDHIAILNDGSTAMETELGTFSTSGRTITFVPEQWTCRGSDPPNTLNFSVTGATFTVTDSAAVVAFQKFTPTGGSGAATLGCFDNTAGTFTPSPLGPVP